MDYYAATLREPGTKLNNDGLMVKGIRIKNRPDLVVMVISSCGTDKKICERIIKTAEKLAYKGCDKDVKLFLKKLFDRFGKRGLLIKRKIPEITVLVIEGIEYFIMNRGNNRIAMVERLGVRDVLGENVWREQEGYSSTEGRLSEGSTLIAGNSAFFDRQLLTEIHRRLCPQMCLGENEMQNNLEYLRSQLWSRGETRPVTAVALCVK